MLDFKKIINEKTFIIAEAGVNHNGDLEIAKKLIDAAVSAGADAVKFQTFSADRLVTKNAPKANYQNETTDKDESQYDMLKKLELTFEEHKVLKNYCEEKDILFMSTPFDFESADLLEKLDVKLYKIGSGDLTNLPLLKYVANKNRSIILSTGMSNLAEVEEAVNSIKKTGNSNLILLHCVSNYPAVYEDLNLRAMVTLKEAFKLPTGYSDHSPGIEVPIAAVAMGAQVVEKHFTLDKNMEGPDHQASLTPTELNQMIKSIRNVETGIGDGIKKIQKREIEIKKVAQKSLKAARTIKIGEEINENNITIKRPADGLAPNFFERLDSNFVANKIIKKDENIKLENLNSKKGIDLNGIL